MNNTFIRQIGLFFFLALPEESLAIETAVHAALEYNKSQKIKNHLSAQSQLIGCCHQVLIKTLRSQKKISSSVFKSYHQNVGNMFQWPENVDKGPWREFRRHASIVELTAVVWSAILKNSDSDIADGLNITEGTVRYRVGKGLLLLGSLNRL
jgi:hypothetical protein